MTNMRSLLGHSSCHAMRPRLLSNEVVRLTPVFVCLLSPGLQNLPVDGPVDNYMAKLMYYGKLDTYLPASPIVTQLGQDSDIEHTCTNVRYVPPTCSKYLALSTSTLAA